MLHSVPSAFHTIILIQPSPKPYEVATITIPISKMVKPKVREMESLVQGSTSVQTQVCLILKSKFFTPTLYCSSLSGGIMTD